MNAILSRLRFLTAGESHGPALVAILEGMVAGLPLTQEDIDRELARRQKAFGAGGRMRIEKDHARILGGVMAGHTTGAPIALLLENRDHVHWVGKEIPPMTIPRPGHADLTAAVKYGYRELRLALERASARETAARVAVGAVCKAFLRRFHIRVGSYVLEIGGVRPPLPSDMPYEERFAQAEANDLRAPTVEGAEAMRRRVREAMAAKDTVGGVYEVVALGVPPGLGSHVHWDRRLTARVAAAMLSIPAMKGVEIGPAFENARRPGTQVHDEIFLEGETIVRRTNRAGGIEGGITTGMPLVVRVAMKPISTTLTPLRSVDLAQGKPARTRYERSDINAVPRAAVVAEAMLAIVLADALLEKLGGDSMEELLPRFRELRQLRLGDLPMEEGGTYWERKK